MYVPKHLTEIFTFENLLKAFRSSASNHRHKEDVQEFLNHLYLNIRRIEKIFKKGEYPEITYHSFVVKQPKLRVVWATSFEIRECGVWPNYFKVLDDEQESGKSDE